MICRKPFRPRARRVALVLMDVDGVLTDGRLGLEDHGREARSWHVRDGSGIVLARRAGLLTGFLSGRGDAGVRRRARELGATEVEVVNDSELIAKQVTGDYRVKHADLKPLHAQALEALRGFERWSIRSVPRAENADADALVNQALDADPEGIAVEPVETAPATHECAGGTDYATYLLIDDLLGLQRPLTPDAHDELLFIVVHQVYEL